MVRVYSMDSCHVNNLDYCIYMHPPPHFLNSPLANNVQYISLLLCLLPCFYPWLPSQLGSSLFFPQPSGCSKLSNGECYLLILGHYRVAVGAAHTVLLRKWPVWSQSCKFHFWGFMSASLCFSCLRQRWCRIEFVKLKKGEKFSEYIGESLVRVMEGIMVLKRSRKKLIFNHLFAWFRLLCSTNPLFMPLHSWDGRDGAHSSESNSMT